MVFGTGWHPSWCPGLVLLYVILLLRTDGVSGDLSLLLVQNIWCTCRVTEMAPPIIIHGGASFIFTNSSVAMEFSISTIISTKLSAAKSYVGRVRSPRLFPLINTFNGIWNYGKIKDVRLYHWQRLRIWWYQHGAPVLARTHVIRWRRRLILVVSVPAGNTKRIPERQWNHMRRWSLEQQWWWLSHHHCHTFVKRTNSLLTQ